ncbi:MAG: UDP-3-O-(3-hydroxymyristoyl)glucosamine N-acyltransferase [Planctomycetaceae bacterium]|nr:UDP-3-O-(3-hydroxymyristoyl)glucosamine N-acyltransferase [Planctomycetaceae bacterium]
MTGKQITLGQLVDLLSAELHGDPDFVVTDAGTIRECKSDWITFASDEKHFRKFEDSEAQVAIVSCAMPESAKMTIRVEDPVASFAQTVRLFRKMMKPRTKGIHPSAIVSATAQLGSEITIAAGVIIGDHVSIGDGSCVLENTVLMDGSEIGRQVIIFPNVTIYDNTRIGNRCILHAGCKLGSYGFGYSSVDGRHLLSDQLGYVEIEDEVEIGANSCIDRGTFGSTLIGEGTKIDNLVQIGHNCQIGKHNLICAQVGIAGSAATGDYVVIGGQAGIADHVEISAKTMIGAQSGAISDLQQANYFGTPARQITKAMKEFAALRKLPKMIKQLRQIEKQLEAISETAESSQQDAA